MFSTYFSGRFILSKKALISVVFSDRSDGKTFDCKVRALEDYRDGKFISIYMRRYKTEITDKMYNSFFDEVVSKSKYSEFKDWKFKGSKKGIQVLLPNAKEWDWIIYFIPLTMSGKLKSQISDIERIKIINYDEFIPLDNRYIKDEMNLLLEFYKSIDRDRFTTQMIILGNKITPFNPLFDFFNVELGMETEKIRLYKNGALAVQIYANKEHRETRKNSPFNNLVKGTEYEAYDNGGVLKLYNIKLKKREGFEYLNSFKTEKGEGTIWYKDGQMVISPYRREDGYLITDQIYNTDRKQYVCTYGKFGTTMKSIYKRGDMFFEDNKTFYLFENILRKICAN